MPLWWDWHANNSSRTLHSLLGTGSKPVIKVIVKLLTKLFLYTALIATTCFLSNCGPRWRCRSARVRSTLLAALIWIIIINAWMCCTSTVEAPAASSLLLLLLPLSSILKGPWSPDESSKQQLTCFVQCWHHDGGQGSGEELEEEVKKR